MTVLSRSKKAACSRPYVAGGGRSGGRVAPCPSPSRDAVSSFPAAMLPESPSSHRLPPSDPVPALVSERLRPRLRLRRRLGAGDSGGGPPLESSAMGAGGSCAGESCSGGWCSGGSGSGTSGSGTSGSGGSGSGTSGHGTSGCGTSGHGTSGHGTSGHGTLGTGTSGSGRGPTLPPSGACVTALGGGAHGSRRRCIAG